MEAFTPSRPDGRSDRRVIFEHAKDAAPETTFTYEILEAALSVGLDEPVARDRVYRAVAQANKTLLRESKRYLSVVRGTGYRVISADEHLPVALNKKDSAEKYLRRGAELLDHVRIGELTPEMRMAVEGNRLMFAGVISAIQQSARRHDRAEALITDLASRVERLEDKPLDAEQVAS